MAKMQLFTYQIVIVIKWQLVWTLKSQQTSCMGNYSACSAVINLPSKLLSGNTRLLTLALADS